MDAHIYISTVGIYEMQKLAESYRPIEDIPLSEIGFRCIGTKSLSIHVIIPSHTLELGPNKADNFLFLPVEAN
jgi:hypothetical protein